MSGPVVIDALAKQTATLLFLHGLGDTGHGWASAIGEIRPPYVKVICPTAPTAPVTLNAGFRMPSWFDLKSLDASGAEDEDGIKKAASVIHGMVDAEIKSGIAPNRIVVGGFSQGGALALYSVLTYPVRLGGVMALSCWLPLHKTFPAAVKGDNENTPIIQGHGDCDPIVPYKWGQLTASIIKSFAKQSEFKTYKEMMHSASPEEMKDLKAFLAKHIPSI